MKMHDNNRPLIIFMYERISLSVNCYVGPVGGLGLVECQNDFVVPTAAEHSLQMRNNPW